LARLYYSFKYDVAFDQVDLAREQRELWIKNFSCAKDVQSKTMRLEDGTSVSAMVCPSGDILVQVAPQGSSRRLYRWIKTSDLLTRPGAEPQNKENNALNKEVP
jgi:hypothetical protein